MAGQSTYLVEMIREDRDEFLLLVFVGLIALVVFHQSQALLPRTRQVPLIIASMLVVVLGMTVVMKFYGEQIKELTGLGARDTSFLADIEADSSDAETEHLFDLNARQVIKHFGWLVLYLLGLIYVGFWTTNVVFPLVYIMRYETSPLPRRFAYYLLCTGVIVSTLWILFVELLNIQSIWRLGFLP